MALISQSQVEQSVGIRQQESITLPEPVEREKPGVIESFAAGFRRENTIYNMFAGNRERAENAIIFDIPEAGFDPLDELEKPENEVYRQYASSATNLTNSIQFSAWKNKIDKQNQDLDTLSRGGFAGMLGAMAGGAIDPLVLLPGMVYIKGARTMKSVATGLVSGAGLGVGSIAAQEAILHGAQPTRTIGETAMALTAGAFIGGTLGAGAAGLSVAKRNKLVEITKKALRAEGGDDIFGPGSVGAAQLNLAAEQGVAGINDWLVKGLSGNSMVAQGLTSKSGIIRQFSRGMYETPLRSKGSVALDTPEQVAVESLLDVDQAALTRMNMDTRDITTSALKKMRKEGIRMNSEEFNKRVAIAMGKGDVDDIPEVAAVAARYRKEVDKAWNRLQELGIIQKSEGFEANKSWFLQTWNRDAILADRDKFAKYLFNKFEDKMRSVDEFIDPDDITANPTDGKNLFDSVEQTIDNILGIGDDSIEMDRFLTMGTDPKSTKPRKIDVPQEEAIREGWLVSDAEFAVNSFLHKANTAIRLREFLQNNPVGGEVLENFTQLKKAVRDELSEVLPDKSLLAKEVSKANAYIDNTVDMISGTFGMNRNALGTALRTLRKFNASAMLGGVVISSIPDTAGHILVNGMGRTINNSLKPLLKNISAAKLAREQMADLVLGARVFNNSILQRLTETGSITGRTVNKIDRYGDAGMAFFGKLTGMDYWNSGHRLMAAVTSEARTLRALQSKFKLGQKLGRNENRRLLDLGLSEADQQKIIEQFDKYGEEIDGSFIGNFDRWTDQSLKDKFAAGINKEVNNVILKPGAGDLPAWAQTEIGKTVGQFKSFIFTASHRLLLRAVQRHDAQTFMHLFAAIGLGAAVGQLKAKIAGREIATTNPVKFVAEGISRSGVAGVLGESFFGLNPWSGSTRFAGLKFTNFIFGPSLSTLSNAYSSVSNMRGGYTEEEWRKLGRLMPFNNLFYLKAAANAFGD